MNFNIISKKIGLTRTEFNVLLVLVVVFFTGITIKVLQSRNNYIEKIDYNYSYTDSLFYFSGYKDENIRKTSNSSDKIVDYKQEVLDFSDDKFIKKSHKITGNKLINVNTADILTFTELPGIGVKTAEKILDLREKNGGFKNIEELKEVKGIGIAKFEKIKKYLIIE